MPRDGPRKIAIRLLDQQAVAKVEHVAVEGERVAVPPLPLGRACFLEQMRRLPDQIERQVGEAEIDLQHRPVPGPFAEPLAED